MFRDLTRDFFFLLACNYILITELLLYYLNYFKSMEIYLIVLIWSSLVNIPSLLGKNVHLAISGWKVTKIAIGLNWFRRLYIFSLFLLIFFLLQLSVLDRDVLKFPNIIADLCIFPFNSAFFSLYVLNFVIWYKHLFYLLFHISFCIIKQHQYWYITNHFFMVNVYLAYNYFSPFNTGLYIYIIFLMDRKHICLDFLKNLFVQLCLWIQE